MAPSARRAKRTVDVLVALVGLIALAPVGLLAALIVRLESRGPILRRTPSVGIERRAPRSASTGGRRLHDVRGRLFNRLTFRVTGELAEGGTRATLSGALLRVTHFAGWPQLFNVLAGQMSLVGPRAVDPAFADRLHRDFPPLHLGFSGLRPGLFGLGQLAGPATDDAWARISEALLSDRVYERRVHRSGAAGVLAIDLAILGRAVWALLRPVTPRRGNDVVRIEYPARLGQVELCPRALSQETPAGLGAEVTENDDGVVGFWYPRRGRRPDRGQIDDGLVAELCDEVRRSAAPAALVLGKALRPGPTDEPDVLRVEAPTSLDGCHHLCQHLEPLWQALASRVEDGRFAATMSVLLIEGLATASRLAPAGVSRVAITVRLERDAVRLAFDPLDTDAEVLQGLHSETAAEAPAA